MRLAMKRSRSGLMVWSCVPTRYQLGTVFHAASVSASLNDADRDLRQGATEQRFGFDEARARREAAKKATADSDGGVPEPGLGSNGSLIQSHRQ